jgi:hypothetical protein
MSPARFWLGALFLCCGSTLVGQAIPAANSRGAVSPELMRFLQLSAEQASGINRLAAAWNAELQVKAQRADQARGTTGRATEAAAATLESICREATASRDALMQKTRALLDAGQLLKLQLLDDALNLFPRVLEAQSAGLLTDSVETSPIGMPGGQITVGLAFTAGPPKPLPGCQPAKTEARPGIVPGR